MARLATMSEDPAVTLFMLALLSLCSMGISTMIIKLWRSYKALQSGQGNLMTSIFSLGFILSIFIVGELIGIVFLATQITLLGAVILLIVIIFNIFFYQALKKPTMTGRKIMDQIEGFKMFLSTANIDEIKKANPPEMTEEIYELYLPYAIAMGVENDWCTKFENEIKKIVANDKTYTYHPTWYRSSSKLSSANLGTTAGTAIAMIGEAKRTGGSSALKALKPTKPTNAATPIMGTR